MFMGERGHLISVGQALVDGGCISESERIDWREIDVPPRNLWGWRRLNSEGRWCKEALRAVSESAARLLILSSITDTGLLVLKALLKARRPSVPVLATVHGVLASIERRQPRRPWNWVTSFRQVLRLPHPKQLTYLVLAPSIRASLAETMPGVVSSFAMLDLPYFMPSTCCGASASKDRITFGFFGVGHTAEKGLGEFFRLAAEIRRSGFSNRCDFALVGFVTDAGGSLRDLSHAVRGVSPTPLAPAQYAERARDVTYAVGMAEPSHYRLVASASFLDALRYGKPGIYLRNRYLEHYFDRLGDIGYLCGSYEEVRETVFMIVEEFPERRYRQQCENIGRGREIFAPHRVASQLVAVFDHASSQLHKRH
jgi:hypothetical protein